VFQRGDVAGFIGRSAALAELRDDTGDDARFNGLPRLAVGIHQEQRGIIDDMLSGNVFHRAGKLNLIVQDIADGLAATELEHRYIDAGLLRFKPFKS